MKASYLGSPIRFCLAAALLAVAGHTTILHAATAMQARLELRPLTPQDIKDYKLTGAQGASGLSTVGLGQPVYLDALVNSAIPAAEITNVSWALTAKPAGSTADLGESPLGTRPIGLWME